MGRPSNRAERREAAAREQIVEDGSRRCQLRRSKGDAAAIFAAIQGYFVLAATARSLVPLGSAAAATHRMATGLLDPAAERSSS